MVATDLGTNTKLYENNVFQVDDELSLLKSAAVYGANASGKSNLAKAIGFMRRFVLNSSKNTQITDSIDVEQFRLNAETIERPSFFEIVFFLNKRIYRYGFEVNRKEIITEWLFHTPTSQERQLFYRKINCITIHKGSFKEGDKIEDKTRFNALFLSVVAQFNGKISQEILLWFARLGVISGIQSHWYTSHTLELLDDKKYKKDILQLIKKLDLGIDNIFTEEAKVSLDSLPKTMPESLRKMILKDMLETEAVSVDVKTIHKQYDSDGNIVGTEEFDMEQHESEGTKKLFALAGIILKVLREQRVLLIDELDARLHPLITKTLIESFNSKDTNAKNAQLIFITHDTNLLTNKIFRRDQIWFVEKDQYEASDLYSLFEYDISDDASFKSDYIKGRYGAIPFIGDLRSVIIDHNAEVSEE
ncbi:MAG: ATP-binding protein [Xenococcaceae cyanobacterium MO_207.B15]|nr:ATP-binding protein [Xenococcaceae cyanobacterium MO_207.B15]